ncbi:g11577 [Coccomyxa elongata]
MRSLVHDCLAKHLYDSAIFYADKLMTMSNGAAADVYTLAEALYMGKQWRRALALLRNAGLIEADVRCRYLAARCLAEVQDWEECLNVLGGWDESELEALSMQDVVLEEDIGREVSYTSAMCLLRGRVYEALENRGRAIRWYKAALHMDPFCYEAFRALIEGHMLTSGEEASLRENLHYREEDRWLHLYYRAKCKKYDQQPTMEATLETLEAPAPTPVPVVAPVAPSEETSTPLQPSASAKLNAHKDTDLSPGVRTRSMVQRSSSPSDMEEDLDEDAENAGKGGCGLGGNLDVSVCRAEWYFHLGAYQECHALTSQLLDQDPYAIEALPVHLAAALELRKKNELFLRAHKLVEEYPDRAVSWFGVACYYLCIGRYESARNYFGKATTVDASFAPAWLGFGHAFAAQDESDQAMAAYRTAARLFPGLHLPLLGMGCEYARMNNTTLAEQLLLSAHHMCPQDPLPCNELGCLLFRAKNYDAAERWLSRALERMPGRLDAALEPTLVNLGHTLRKQKRYNEAIKMLEKALSLSLGQAGTYSALGYTYHLQGRMQDAIENYHKALSLRPEDTFTAEMLTAAVVEYADEDFTF